MEVVVLYVKGCPNQELAESRLRTAAERLGRDLKIRPQRVESLTQAEELGFRGSPTLLVEGVDLFPKHPGATGLTCRLYPTERGLEGAPSLTQLEKVLSERE